MPKLSFTDIDSLNYSTSFTIHDILAQETVVNKPPKVVLYEEPVTPVVEGVVNAPRYKLDQMYLVELGKSYLTRVNTVVTAQDGFRALDLSQHAGRHIPAVKNQTLTDTGASGAIDFGDDPLHISEPCINLFHAPGCGLAHSHWLLQAFNKAYYAKKLAPHRKLVVLDTIKSYQINMLNSIGIPESALIVRNAGTDYTFEDLAVFYTPNDILCDLSPYNHLKQSLNIPKKRNYSGRRIFISRGNSLGPRMFLNEDEAFEVLSEFGFEKLDSGKLTLAEQVEVFRDADAIAGPIGAGLYNMLYNENPNLKVLGLSAPNYFTAWFSQACSYVNADYGIVFGSVFGFNDKVHFGTHGNWIIDTDKVATSVKELNL